MHTWQLASFVTFCYFFSFVPKPNWPVSQCERLVKHNLQMDCRYTADHCMSYRFIVSRCKHNLLDWTPNQLQVRFFSHPLYFCNKFYIKDASMPQHAPLHTWCPYRDISYSRPSGPRVHDPSDLFVGHCANSRVHLCQPGTFRCWTDVTWPFSCVVFLYEL